MKVTRMGLILGLGRSPGEGNGNPLQYSCLKNSMKRGGWWATVCAWAKNQTWARCYITTVSTYVSILHGWITSHHQFCGFNTAPTCNLGASHVDERSGYTHTHIRVYQSYSTLGSPKDCSPLGSSVHGNFQARILEWIAIFYSKVWIWHDPKWYSAYSPRPKSNCGWAVSSYDSSGDVDHTPKLLQVVGQVPSLGVAGQNPSPSCFQRAAALSYLGPLSGSCQIPLFTASNSR